MQQYCNVLVTHCYYMCYSMCGHFVFEWEWEYGCYCYPGFDLICKLNVIYECWNWSSVSQDLCNICTNKYEEPTGQPGVCGAFCIKSCAASQTGHIMFSVQWIVILSDRIFVKRILLPYERKYQWVILILRIYGFKSVLGLCLEWNTSLLHTISCEKSTF